MSGLKEAVKNVVERLPLPAAEAVWQMVSACRPTPPWRKRDAALLERLGRPSQVASGPFQGMRLSRSVWGHLAPKILGTYELELWPSVEQFCRRPLDAVVNIGAAEGYYAIGFARRVPTARVVCYEIDQQSIHLLRVHARSNDVLRRVEIARTCTPEGLNATLAKYKNALVVCDCEGDERVLLDPVKVPSLRSAAVLVETHDFLVPAVHQELITRFTPSHSVEVVQGRPRVVSDLPGAFSLSEEEALEAMAEHRPADARWIVLEPTDRGCPGPEGGR
jgi:hypothetical protein